jgi:hypothetical protein
MKATMGWWRQLPGEDPAPNLSLYGAMLAAWTTVHGGAFPARSPALDGWPATGGILRLQVADA